MSYSETLSAWVADLQYQQLPEALVRHSRLRIIDVIGLALAGHGTAFGQSVVNSTLALAPQGCSRIFGTGAATTVTSAAFANGALSQALEFDDTHNRSIVHMSGPSVACALALADRDDCSFGKLITAIALGSELACRIGSVAPGQFHRRGFHPTGLFSAFGCSWLAGSMLGATAQQMTNAAGIVGSYAAGLLQCWVDGTQSKFLHPGWAAQSGITAATLAQHGTTGPVEVLEGRFGLFASHLQNPELKLNYAMLTDKLGEHWESEYASFKPYPVAHVIHPYIDALFRVLQANQIKPADIQSINCPVSEYIVGIVCEPAAEKRRPLSDSHGRVSLQYTLAEAAVLGKITRHSYTPAALANPEILQLADRINFYVDKDFPGPERFKGQVEIVLHSGQRFTEIEEHNRGSLQNPMTDEEIFDKFYTNIAGVLSLAQGKALIETVMAMTETTAARNIIDATIA